MSTNVHIAARSVQFWTHHSAPAFTCFSLGSLFVRPATGGWFVGKDVAEALGYSNTRDALSKHVDEDDKATVAFHDGSQNRNVTAVNESGLYSVTCQGRVAQAGTMFAYKK